MIEEIVFADGAHVGADALSKTAIELLERNSLPLRRGLYNLGSDGVFVPIIGDVELNGSSRGS